MNIVFQQTTKMIEMYRILVDLYSIKHLQN